MDPDSINTSVAICGTVASLSRFQEERLDAAAQGGVHTASEHCRAADDPEIYEYGFSVMEFPCFDVVLCTRPAYYVHRFPH